VSPKECSLAVDVEEHGFVDQEFEATLTLLVSKRHKIVDSSSETGSSHDVVEIGGTITVSF